VTYGELIPNPNLADVRKRPGAARDATRDMRPGNREASKSWFASL